MSQDALNENQFPKPRAAKLLGYLLSQPPEPGERHGWYGTLCTTCKKKAESRGEEFKVEQELRGRGDKETIEVCQSCGRTVQGQVKTQMEDW